MRILQLNVKQSQQLKLEVKARRHLQPDLMPPQMGAGNPRMKVVGQDVQDQEGSKAQSHITVPFQS